MLNKGKPNLKDYNVGDQLTGGMMNSAFIAEKEGLKYVLYIPGEYSNKLVNRASEYYHLSIACREGIAPQNVFFDLDKGIKINEYIEGDSLNHLDSWNYKEIADLLHRFHKCGPLSNVDYNPFLRLEEYEKESYGLFHLNETYKEFTQCLYKYRAYLENQTKVLSHNDAQRSNFLLSNKGRYYLIDYEFAANNDEIYDIACFGNDSVKEGRKLLDAYFSEPSLDHIKRFYLWRIFISMQWYLVAELKNAKGEGEKFEIDFKAVADHFIDNAKESYEEFLKTFRYDNC